MSRPRRGRAKSPGSKSGRAARPGPPGPPTHIVALVGSAGALDALKRFFASVAPDLDAAFLVAVHRERGSRGLLGEVLARFTSMPVVSVAAPCRIATRTVYVFPTDREVTLRDDTLVVGPRDRVRRSLDDVLRAVAADRGERSIGILLSGMNADGTRGLEELRAHGGRAFVQDPSTAAYKTMPESALAAGIADTVGSPETLGQRLGALPAEVAPTIERILAALAKHTGHSLQHYKRSTLTRRIERRMGVLHLTDVGRYAQRIEQDPEEANALFADLLIGVTGFFRDPDAFEALRKSTLPVLLRTADRARPLRIWIAGCASGEEAYTIAILVREALDALPRPQRVTVQIYATDLDATAITRARAGRYPAGIADALSPARLERFFVAEKNGGYRVQREIREMVVFATHDLTADPPFTKLDLLTCRNVLIYLDAEAQKRLLALFFFALRPGGALFLGGSESLSGAERGFEIVDAKSRLFRRREVARHDALALERALGLERSTAPSWLRDGGPFPSTSRPPVASRESIRELVQLAVEELGVPVGPRAGARGRRLSPSRAATRILALTNELETFRREAQVTYEELQSTNEELKSTNEELLTAREETQAMNEELLTLNAELEAKNESLEITNDDMRNLLNSSQIPTLFLDERLRLKRFTAQATRIANLIPSDVGRPITDIVLHVIYDDLAGAVRRVLETLVFVEARVPARDGATFTMRIHPYRTAQNVIDGVVVTFLDVSALLAEAQALRDAGLRELARALLGRWPAPAYVVDATGRTLGVSPETSRVLGHPLALLAGATRELWGSLRHPADRVPSTAGETRCRLRRSDGSYVAVRETRADLLAPAEGGTLTLVTFLPEPDARR